MKGKQSLYSATKRVLYYGSFIMLIHFLVGKHVTFAGNYYKSNAIELVRIRELIVFN